MTGPVEERRLDLVGDGWDAEPLLTAEDVGRVLRVPAKAVYELPIPRVRISSNRVRWRPGDIRAWIDDRTEGP